jgi:hypothetical protein
LGNPPNQEERKARLPLDVDKDPGFAILWRAAGSLDCFESVTKTRVRIRPGPLPSMSELRFRVPGFQSL